MSHVAEKCPNFQRNFARCPCTYEPCDVKGICCECIRRHLARNELPACFFPPEVERTFDRSVERFIEAYKKTGRVGWFK